MSKLDGQQIVLTFVYVVLYRVMGARPSATCSTCQRVVQEWVRLVRPPLVPLVPLDGKTTQPNCLNPALVPVDAKTTETNSANDRSVVVCCIQCLTEEQRQRVCSHCACVVPKLCDLPVIKCGHSTTTCDRLKPSVDYWSGQPSPKPSLDSSTWWDLFKWCDTCIAKEAKQLVLCQGCRHYQFESDVLHRQPRTCATCLGQFCCHCTIAVDCRCIHPYERTTYCTPCHQKRFQSPVSTTACCQTVRCDKYSTCDPKCVDCHVQLCQTCTKLGASCSQDGKYRCHPCHTRRHAVCSDCGAASDKMCNSSVCTVCHKSLCSRHRKWDCCECESPTKRFTAYCKTCLIVHRQQRTCDHCDHLTCLSDNHPPQQHQLSARLHQEKQAEEAGFGFSEMNDENTHRDDGLRACWVCGTYERCEEEFSHEWRCGIEGCKTRNAVTVVVCPRHEQVEIKLPDQWSCCGTWFCQVHSPPYCSWCHKRYCSECEQLHTCDQELETAISSALGQGDPVSIVVGYLDAHDRQWSNAHCWVCDDTTHLTRMVPLTRPCYTGCSSQPDIHYREGNSVFLCCAHKTVSFNDLLAQFWCCGQWHCYSHSIGFCLVCQRQQCGQCVHKCFKA